VGGIERWNWEIATIPRGKGSSTLEAEAQRETTQLGSGEGTEGLGGQKIWGRRGGEWNKREMTAKRKDSLKEKKSKREWRKVIKGNAGCRGGEVIGYRVRSSRSQGTPINARDWVSLCDGANPEGGRKFRFGIGGRRVKEIGAELTEIVTKPVTARK